MGPGNAEACSSVLFHGSEKVCPLAEVSGAINGFYRLKPQMYPKEMQQAANLSEKTTPFFFMHVSDPKLFLQEGS